MAYMKSSLGGQVTAASKHQQMVEDKANKEVGSYFMWVPDASRRTDLTLKNEMK